MSLTLWQPKSASSEPVPTWIIMELHGRLLARYGSLWADRYGMVPQHVLEEEWSRELAGFTKREIHRGLTSCRNLKFPPTLPEFMQLCRPPIESEAAYHEALRNMRERESGKNPAWTHPAIYWAAVTVTFHDMRLIPWERMRRRWEKALSDEMEKGQWPEIPVARIALPEPARKASPEILAQMKALTERMRLNTQRRNDDATDEPA